MSKQGKMVEDQGQYEVSKDKSGRAQTARLITEITRHRVK